MWFCHWMGPCLRLKWIVQGATVLTKQKTLLKSGAGVESNRVKETRRTALTCGSQSQVLWWVGLGELGLSLASHLAHAFIQSNTGPFLVACASLNQNDFQHERVWEVGKRFYGLVFSPLLWRKWQTTPVFSPGESHGQRSLSGYSPRGHKELDATEATNTHFSPSWPLLGFPQVGFGPFFDFIVFEESWRRRLKVLLWCPVRAGSVG